MADVLRTDILRIASELPVGDPTRRKLLASIGGKEAGGDPDVLWKLLDKRGYYKLKSEMKKEGDEQSSKLLDEIGLRLMRSLQLSDDEQRAFNRLSGSIHSMGRWDAATQRNNIFKAANHLGIKLPSGMF
jgi:hypothetical protein